MKRIIILTKAPVPGVVKTRLLPVYSAAEAAQLQALMTGTVVQKSTQVCNDVWLAVDDIAHDSFYRLAAQFKVKLCHQGSGDLGERLTRLMDQSFASDNKALMFLGSDSPHVSQERYLEAFAQLKSADVVIGPVEDGGYDLILLKQSHGEIFKEITWSSGLVLQQTLDRCRAEKLQVHLLSRSFDLDRPEDVKRAPPESWQA